MASASGVDETLDRINAQQLIHGIIVVDANGFLMTTNLPERDALKYAQQLQKLTKMARSTVRELDPGDDLNFFSIRAHPHEYKIIQSNDLLLITILNIQQ